MRIERFEDIEAWQLARELSRKIYGLTKKAKFTRDFGLKRQIQDTALSSKGFIGSRLVKVNKEKATLNF
ncbi:MAG: four helix bundle protein [Candidatus Desulfatibia sp.]|uniref:four helix bundle protein n=1 Tax=Candidatus Desulfatibia sp. TaxID=3101189 RepID=UPI002F33233A